MSESVRGRLEAAAVAIAPLFLLALIAYHPFIVQLSDPAQVAAAMAADPTRWALAHLGVGAGFGLLLLAMLAVRSYLKEQGEDNWSARAVPFLVMGTVFFTFLPAMETAMVAGFEAGTDAVVLQTELDRWFVPMLLTSAVLFGAGSVLLALGVTASGAFDRRTTWLISGALVVAALTRFAPFGAALFASSIASLIALLPFASRMWRRAPAAGRGRRSALAGSRT